jgi:UDP-glucose 4-epimerase
MRALVTGANGFLGRHVVAELLRRGHAVRALVRPSARVAGLRWPEAVELVRADLRVARDLGPAFDGVDVVIHLAAAVTGDGDAQFAAAVVGTERLLGAMAGAGTRRLVLASSFSVYDWRAARGTLDERTPVVAAPLLYERDGYAVAKVWQERVARRESDRQGWELTVLRPGFIWGPGHGYLACLSQRAGPVHLVFGPTTRLPLTHVENCAACFALAAEHSRAAGETFNVVDGDALRAWGYLGDHLRLSGERGLRVPIPYALAAAGVRLAHASSKLLFRGKGKLPSLLVPCRFEARFKPLRFSNRKAREVLGWRPELIYQEGLRRTYGSAARVPRAAAGAAPAVVHRHD